MEVLLLIGGIEFVLVLLSLPFPFPSSLCGVSCRIPVPVLVPVSFFAVTVAVVNSFKSDRSFDFSRRDDDDDDDDDIRSFFCRIMLLGLRRLRLRRRRIIFRFLTTFPGISFMS